MNETTNSKKSQFKTAVYIAAIVIPILSGLFLYIYYTSNTDISTPPVKNAMSSVTANGESKDVVIEEAQRQIKELQDKNTVLQKQLEDTAAKQVTFQQSLMDRLDQLEVEKSEKAYREQAQSYHSDASQIHEIDNSIQEIKINLSERREIINRPQKNIDTYVPAGTFVKAVMIGGADASAAVQSQALVSPMIFRIIENGTLPNHKKSHLKNCVVTGGVFGDISSERGLIRTDRLSCVFPNGQVLDTKISGTIFGPEGKNGVRGIPLWRENALLQRAFAAGALSGLAEGITNSYSTQSVSPEGVVSAIKNGKIFQASGAKGIGKAMEKLANYNIQRAEQYHPVIQLSAGTVVDIVFLEGFYLDDENTPTKNPSVQNRLFETTNENPWGLSPGKLQTYAQTLRGEG